MKDDAETVENAVIYSEDGTIASEYKTKYNKPTNNDTVKLNAVYGVAANGDIFNETSSHLSNVVVTASNNNIENASLLLPRKRKTKSNAKQKKTKTQGNMHDDNLSVLQMPSTIGSIQNSETLVTSSLPVDINKMLPKQEKVDGISVSVSDEQFQIYLIET